MSHGVQRSAGSWDRKILPKNLRDLLKNPEGIYDNFIRPIIEGERLQGCRFCGRKFKVKELKTLETKEGSYYCCSECFDKQK